MEKELKRTKIETKKKHKNQLGGATRRQRQAEQRQLWRRKPPEKQHHQRRQPAPDWETTKNEGNPCPRVNWFLLLMERLQSAFFRSSRVFFSSSRADTFRLFK
jgi:hypothetical protein